MNPETTDASEIVGGLTPAIDPGFQIVPRSHLPFYGIEWSDAKLKREIDEGRFCVPVYLGPRLRGFVLAELLDYIKGLKEHRHSPECKAERAEAAAHMAKLAAMRRNPGRPRKDGKPKNVKAKDARSSRKAR